MQGRVFLKRGHAKPVFAGHPWVYSGAVDRIEGEPEDGSLVEVCGDKGDKAGIGFLNRASQIVVRMVAFGADAALEPDFPAGRIRRACRFRREVLKLDRFTDAWRAVYAEADGLPGLVVDRYADILAVQFHSLGMERRRDEILDCIEDELHPKGIIDRSDPSMRKKEGLPSRKGVLRGSVPDEPFAIEENGLRFLVDVQGGQKTGHYLDQRDNRALTKDLARGRKVLDAFTYTGAFAVCAAAGGAAEVHAFDSSGKFIELAKKNAELNGHTSIRFEEADAFQKLQSLAARGERFDFVILDPPKLARNAAAARRALGVYRELNFLGLRLLNPAGLLVTCSCSHHVPEAALEDAVRLAALQAGREASIFHRGAQASDHPASLLCPESRYLTCLFLRVF
jgi:23S rRNA (cytosine1962-C5)-methyltransferase